MDDDIRKMHDKILSHVTSIFGDIFEDSMPEILFGKFDEPFNGTPNPANPRDEMLKIPEVPAIQFPEFQVPSELPRKDMDLDDKVEYKPGMFGHRDTWSVFGSFWPFTIEAPDATFNHTNPSNPIERSSSFHRKSSSFRWSSGADGHEEERRTTRDSNGNVTEVIRRRMGDKEHVITTKRDAKGEQEVVETVRNMDESGKAQFDQQWSGRGSPQPGADLVNPERDPSNKGFLRRWFGGYFK